MGQEASSPNQSGGAVAGPRQAAQGPRGVAGLYEDARLKEHFRDGELRALARIVERWSKEEFTPFEARKRFLEEALRGKTHVELTMASASWAANQAGQSGAREGATIGKEIARSLSSSISEVMSQASASQGWAPNAGAQNMGQKAAEALGVLGMLAGGVVGGVGTAVHEGTQEGIRSREVFNFVDRLFLRSTKAQAWELGAQMLGIEGVGPTPEAVETKFQERLRSVLSADQEAVAVRTRNSKEPQTPQGTWLRLVQLCLSVEVVNQLPAPPVRTALPKEPLTVMLRLDEEYLNNRVRELAAAVDRLSGANTGGMSASKISAKCPSETLVENLEEVCPICLEQLRSAEVVRRLPCGHVLHKECCDRWLGTSATCPTCRADMRSG